MSTPDLTAAADVVELARSVVRAGTKTLAAGGGPDVDQVLAYDLAHAGAAVETASSMLDYGALGEIEAAITCAFVADAVGELATRLFGREATWGVDPAALDGARSFCATYRDPAFLAGLAGQEGPRHLDDDFELVQDTFRRFADEKLTPIAEHIHRHNEDIPEDVISGLAEMGAFGLSIPEEYGGYGSGGESEYIGMVVATEELSRGSLGAGGSLITRPEILTRALVKGGTEAQKQRLAAAARHRRGHERRRRHRARLRLRRGRHQGHRHQGRRRLADQRREDLVHLRRPGRRAHAARPHRPGSHQGPPRPVDVRRAQGARRGPWLRARAGGRGGRRRSRRRPHGGSPDRHDRLPGDALLRDRLRRVVRRPTPTSSVARTGSARASTCRWPASRTGACRRQPAPSA